MRPTLATSMARLFLLYNELMDDFEVLPDKDKIGGSNNNGTPDNNPLSRQEEAINIIKAHTAKIDSWGEAQTIIIEKPKSRESFEIMWNFVETIVTEKD